MKLPVPQAVTKQLICPVCGDVLADAVYRRWRGSLVLTDPAGAAIQPLGGALQIRLAEQHLAAASPDARVEAQARLDFVKRHAGELILDLRCPRGHSTLRTVPQVAAAMRRTPGRWVRVG